MKVSLFGSFTDNDLDIIKEYLSDDYKLESSFGGNDVDYVIVGGDISDFVYAKTELERQGINGDKVIYPVLIFQKEKQKTPDLYKIMKEFSQRNVAELLSFGLSYSLRGIDFSMINNSIDYSWHGMDMYYNMKFLEMARSSIACIKRAIMLFPLYYLNYDMSMSRYQYTSGQILSLRGFNDWHNSLKTNDDEIRSYIGCTKLFGEKFFSNSEPTRIVPQNNSSIDSSYQADLPNSWKSYNPRTIEENKVIFRSMTEMLRGIEAYLIIPPIYKQSINPEELGCYEKMKNLYYDFFFEETRKRGIKFIDMSDCISSKECFYDYQHLNSQGRKVYTELLMNVIGIKE